MKYLVILSSTIALGLFCVGPACAQYSATVLADSPLAYYEFNEKFDQEVAVDSSGNGFDSIDNQFAWFGSPGACGAGTAVEFEDGEEASLVLGLDVDPDDAGGATPGTFTIEALVYSDFEFIEEGRIHVFVAQKNGDGLGRSNLMVENSGQFSSFIGGSKTLSSVFIEESTWHHVVMTVNGDDELRFYVDGELANDFDEESLPAGVNGVESATGNWVLGSHKGQTQQFFAGRLDEVAFYDYRLDDPNGDGNTDDSRVGSHFSACFAPAQPGDLQAGDADQDLDFDQFDLIKVQVAAKYLSGQSATWGDGDWDAAPGGQQGSPPPGNGFFDQLDIIAALANGLYLQGPYAAITPGGELNDGQTSIVYDAGTGGVSVDAPVGTQLTSINIDSAASIFTGDAAQNLGGSFDNDADDNIFRATFGSSFGSVSFGNVAQAGLSENFVANDLTVVGSLDGGGELGPVDLVYVPEPSTMALLVLGLVGTLAMQRRRTS